jgi:hypothetical protein
LSDSEDKEKALFLEALELTSVSAQENFLHDACQGDKAMLGRVHSLLRAHHRAGDFMNGDTHSKTSLLFLYCGK